MYKNKDSPSFSSRNSPHSKLVASLKQFKSLVVKTLRSCKLVIKLSMGQKARVR